MWRQDTREDAVFWLNDTNATAPLRVTDTKLIGNVYRIKSHHAKEGSQVLSSTCNLDPQTGSFACFWPYLTSIPPKSSQEQFGNRHSQGLFPVGSVDRVALFWKAGELNEWMQIFLCQLASRIKSGPGCV